MKITFITTIYNEEKTIDKFLESLSSQTQLPDEIIIVDGNSTDATVVRIKKQEVSIKNKKIIFKLVIKEGNRSVGRNEAIRQATGDVIVCSDAGNRLDKNWIKNIVKPFGESQVDVVAGYYKGLAKNIFQKCLIPYVLVMPDKVNPENFLPATRSIAFKKSIWEKVGGFNEKFSHNEDYVFANRLKEIGAKIVFAEDAIVYWQPRNSFKEAFVMFFRFALGDAESGILRTTVLLLFARYFLAGYLLFLIFFYKSVAGLAIVIALFIAYIVWSIKKNYQYVKNKKAFVMLPALQLTADGAVLFGTLIGLLKRVRNFNYLLYLKKNKFLFLILFSYIFILALVLQWGIPNQQHPFPYHMDEWHQLQAVANTFRYGTPNISGSANGTMFHFVLSGFYLMPLTLLHIINPFELQIDSWFMRERLFEILRIQTILFGVLSIFTLYRIAHLIKASKKLVIFLFTFTPIWLMLSGYFKYDIALMFWILLSLLFFIRFAIDPSNKNFIFAAIPASLSIAVKVSAMPFLIIYIFSYFWFHPSWKKDFKYFCAGVSVFISFIFLFGLPDTIFGRGNVLYYLYNNIIETPRAVSNFNLSLNPLAYLVLIHYPLMFGHGLIMIFVIAICFFTYLFFGNNFKKSLKRYRIELFLLFCLLIFAFSLLTIGLTSVGNRTLVLLPFFVLIVGLIFKKLITNKKIKVFVVALILMITIVQVYESFAWLYIKVARSPQEMSSEWIQKNIPKNQTIGVENIPIYQLLPDVVQKEFYFIQYGVKDKSRYMYKIVDSKSKELPSIMVITNGEIEERFLKQSPKKSLAERLEGEGYEKIAVFSPDFTYYRYLGTEEDYYLAGIVAAPVTTSIYRK